MQDHNSLIHADFNDSVSVDFKKDGSFNATLAAKYFGKAPNEWLRLETTQEYIAKVAEIQLRENPAFDINQLVKSKKGSLENGGGTWLDKRLVVAYARWLDIGFSVWCDMQIEKILHEKYRKDPVETALKMFPIAVKAAKQLGLDKNETILAGNRMVRAETGVNMLDKFGLGSIESESQATWHTPTEIGKELNLSAQSVNKLLETLELQEKVADTWSPTYDALGKKYARVFDSGKKHSNGVSIQQVKWSLSVIDLMKERINVVK